METRNRTSGTAHEHRYHGGAHTVWSLLPCGCPEQEVRDPGHQDGCRERQPPPAAGQHRDVVSGPDPATADGSGSTELEVIVTETIEYRRRFTRRELAELTGETVTGTSDEILIDATTIHPEVRTEKASYCEVPNCTWRVRVVGPAQPRLPDWEKASAPPSGGIEGADDAETAEFLRLLNE